MIAKIFIVTLYRNFSWTRIAHHREVVATATGTTSPHRHRHALGAPGREPDLNGTSLDTKQMSGVQQNIKLEEAVSCSQKSDTCFTFLGNFFRFGGFLQVIAQTLRRGRVCFLLRLTTKKTGFSYNMLRRRCYCNERVFHGLTFTGQDFLSVISDCFHKPQSSDPSLHQHMVQQLINVRFQPKVLFHNCRQTFYITFKIKYLGTCSVSISSTSCPTSSE